MVKYREILRQRAMGISISSASTLSWSIGCFERVLALRTYGRWVGTGSLWLGIPWNAPPLAVPTHELGTYPRILSCFIVRRAIITTPKSGKNGQSQPV